ncbi:PLD nuclease N-terminal domain-containing protein [Cryobacterium sp. N22]|uniref:PLDc N-terminal domain-containing protein n=1 Tax=Cryobacterium sp. N22 TaxID=2048290 RepID=UPI000CE36FAB|nr:PLD nuclease N-terminal domain-containing protein [Cryobacterium sp. N22]
MYALFSVVLLVLVVAALVDIITRQDGQVKHLPKVLWVLLVIFLPVIGSLLWFAIGREYPVRAERPSVGVPHRNAAWSGAPAMQPTRRLRTTEEELADLDREIDFHTEQARIRRLEAELAERRRPVDES